LKAPALNAPQILLILAALLAPIFGGYVLSDQTAVDPANLFGGMGEGQAPVLQHVLLALPVFAAMVVLLLRRRIQQIPYPYVAVFLMLLVGGLSFSVAVTSYRALSLNVWIEWAAYGVAYLAAVSGLGRRVGPLALLGAVFVGTVVIAQIGVLDYLGMRRTDPTWRVFCNWNNPNAAAAMLVLGFLCGLSVPTVRERSVNLLLNVMVTVGGALALTALLLTGSKGGTLLALPTGLVMLGLLGGRRHAALYPVAALVLALSAIGFLKSLPYLGPGAALLFATATLWPARVTIGRLAGAVAFSAFLLTFFSSTTPGKVQTTSAGRLAAAASTQDQSATFRLNLWKSAAKLAEERPVTGWGLGSYRYESARPGLVTLTAFSHNSYLQLAAEAGFGALILFVGFIGVWTRRTFRGSSRLPEAQRLPFAAAVGGVASVLAHCLVDSDLSYFGLGLTFFLVMGAASLLAADAVAPEFVPRNSRYVAATGIAALWLFFAYLGWADLAKSEVRFAQSLRQKGDVASLEGLIGWDGDAAYLWAAAQPPGSQEPAMARAFAIHPTPKFARRLARIRVENGDLTGAAEVLHAGLIRDQLNLAALYQLLQVQQAQGLDDQARATAQRIVDVEQTPYYRIRSLEQIVPTETFQARLVLAKDAKDPREKARLLGDAVDGLCRYAQITAPEIMRAAKIGTTFAGETPREAREKTTVGANAARTAASLFRQLGDAKRAAEMTKDAIFLDKAIPAP